MAQHTPPDPPATRTLIRGVRFSPAEWATVEEQASLSGQPPTRYVREAALGAELRARPGALDREAVYHLARLGNNLNQVAKALNEGRGAGDVAGVLAELRQLLGELRR